MDSEFYPKWLSVVTAVNRATDTVTVQEDDYHSRLTLFDLRCLFPVITMSPWLTSLILASAPFTEERLCGALWRAKRDASC